MLLIVAGGLVVVALAIAALGNSGGGGSDASTDSTLPPAAKVITASEAPTDLAVEDNGTSMVVTWTNNAPGDPQYVVRWEDENGGSSSQIGRSGSVVKGLDPDLGYCFLVLLPAGEDEVLTVAQPTPVRGATCSTDPP